MKRKYNIGMFTPSHIKRLYRQKIIKFETYLDKNWILKKSLK